MSTVPAHLRVKGWSEAKAFAATMLRKNPNTYFYRHVAPHESQVCLGVTGACCCQLATVLSLSVSLVSLSKADLYPRMVACALPVLQAWMVDYTC